ncbi:MAG: hypothetical protein KDB14_14590, partial [Planctomycetales bacterium]|nr:hypothetical protein [Planctomycetales bacterium]
MQFSVRHLLLFVAAMGFLFFLADALGPLLMLLITGVVINLAVSRVLWIESIPAGILCGALVHSAFA